MKRFAVLLVIVLLGTAGTASAAGPGEQDSFLDRVARFLNLRPPASGPVATSPGRTASVDGTKGSTGDTACACQSVGTNGTNVPDYSTYNYNVVELDSAKQVYCYCCRVRVRPGVQ